jgi:predicted nucleic-acid-binding Zn-ribbon protein
MGVGGILTRLLPGNRTVVVVECRRCGAAIDPEMDQCPECGTTEFSKYEIEK